MEYVPGMRAHEGIRLVIEFDVTDRDRFVEMATAMVEISKDEPGTLVYDWYVDDERGRGVLYEAYESIEAVVRHTQGPVFTEIAPRYADSLAVVKVDVFGSSPEMEAHGSVLGAPTTFWGAAVAAT